MAQTGRVAIAAVRPSRSQRRPRTSSSPRHNATDTRVLSKQQDCQVRRDLEGLPPGRKWLKFHAPLPYCQCQDVALLRESVRVTSGENGYLIVGESRGLKQEGYFAPCDEHSLQTERAILTPALAARGSKASAARCAFRLCEDGDRSFLHGAALVVGELRDLQTLQEAYGVRHLAERHAPDEACALLAVDLLGWLRQRSSVRILLDAVVKSVHADGRVPRRRHAPKPHHHLSTALSHLHDTRLALQSLSLSNPAILSIMQDETDRYELSCMGGKRDAGESSVEAAMREAHEETGGAIRLGDESRFKRVSMLDMHDGDAMAFWAFVYLGEGAADRRQRLAALAYHRHNVVLEGPGASRLCVDEELVTMSLQLRQLDVFDRRQGHPATKCRGAGAVARFDDLAHEVATTSPEGVDVASAAGGGAGDMPLPVPPPSTDVLPRPVEHWSTYQVHQRQASGRGRGRFRPGDRRQKQAEHRHHQGEGGDLSRHTGPREAMVDGRREQAYSGGASGEAAKAVDVQMSRQGYSGPSRHGEARGQQRIGAARRGESSPRTTFATDCVTREST